MDPAHVSGNRVEWLPQACLRACLHRQGLVDPHTHYIITDLLPGISLWLAALRIRLRGTSHVSRSKYDMRSHRFFVSETIQLCLAVER